MAKLVCEDCGEVLETDVDPKEGRAGAGAPVRDERSGSGDGEEETEGKQPSRNDPDDLDTDDLEEEYEKKTDEMASDDEEAEQVGEEVQEYFDANTGSLSLDTSVGLGSKEASRLQDVEHAASHIAGIFRDRFRQKQKSEIKRGQTEGRFDGRAMIDADRGSRRVKKRIEEGDDLDYEAYFVLDRSASMRGKDVKRAQEAVVTLMVAMEDCGIDTELVDFKGENVTVVKTASRDVRPETSKIFTDGAGSGTPLDKIAEMMEGRISGTSGNPFLVFVTDVEVTGKTKSRYMETVEEMDWPVLAVTIGDDANITDEEGNRLYNYAVRAEDSSVIKQRLEDLARNVIL